MQNPEHAQQTHPALTQLELLDRQPGERVYVRLLLPKNTPPAVALQHSMAWEPEVGKIIPVPIDGYLTFQKDGTTFTRLKQSKESGKWVEHSTHQDGLAYLHRQNDKGYGVYYVVNPGGRENSDITRAPALFYECDSISKTEQWDKVDQLTRAGYQPSLIVETRNSLHVYLRTSEQDISGWQQLQQRLIQRQESDNSIHNANRLMRLAGFNHWRWNASAQALESFPVTLRLSTGNIFSRADLDSLLPEWDTQRWDSKQSTQSKRIETNPALDAWDIRNLATFLDGYNPDGRRGWITCKCPAHNGESDDSLHINQLTGQFKCHGGCDSKTVYSAALELAQSHGYQLPKRHSFFNSSLPNFEWVARLKKFFTPRKSPFGFGGKNKVEVVQEKPTPTAFEYPNGNRIETWVSAKDNGVKHVLDTSPPGAGKSYDTGTIRPEYFGASQVIYLSNEHRNVTTTTLINWSDLEARHDGLTRDEHDRLRRRKEGEAYIIPPNCSRTGTIGALRAKNVPGADTANLACLSCDFLEACRGGHTFDFLNQRAVTLKEPFFRAHPSSLPIADVVGNSDDKEPFDYSDKVLIWEEASRILEAVKTIGVSVDDVRRVISDLAIALPGELFQAIKPLLSALLSLIDGSEKLPYYGLNDELLRQKLPEFSATQYQLEIIRDALKQDVRPLLDKTSEHGIKIEDLPAGVRQRFTDSDEKTAARIKKELALNWLPDFLDVWLKNQLGSLRLDSWGNLTITVRDTRLAEIAASAAFNIYLDGTAVASDIAKPLGIAAEDVSVIRVEQSSKPDNLKFIQIGDLGRLGNNKRADSTLARIDALVNQIKQDTNGEVATFDFKQHTEDGDGKRKHFVDDRGFNDLESASALIIIGTPSENLGSLEDEFTILYGRRPQPGTIEQQYPIKVTNFYRPDLQSYCTIKESVDFEFAAFVRRRTLAKIHQEGGRLRAHRRPNEQLAVYFISDYPLDVPVELRRAQDICPDAASLPERTLAAIKGAAEQLRATGQKVTQAAVAKLAGVSQSTVSRARKLCRTLLDPLNRVLHKNSDPPPPEPPPPESSEFISNKYLPTLSESPLPELVEGVLEVVEAYGAEIFRKIWDATPAEAQIKILGALMLCLDAGELRLLAEAGGVKL